MSPTWQEDSHYHHAIGKELPSCYKSCPLVTIDGSVGASMTQTEPNRAKQSQTEPNRVFYKLVKARSNHKPSYLACDLGVFWLGARGGKVRHPEAKL